MLRPRDAALWLLSLPKRRELVPAGLRAFLEKTAPALAAIAPEPRPKKGPRPGMTDKVRQQRRKLFDDIDEMLNKGAKSVSQAVRDLQEQIGLLPGSGTEETKQQELVRLYNREKPGYR
jgi:hypothetical protein